MHNRVDRVLFEKKIKLILFTNNSVVEFLIYTWFNLIFKEAQIFLKKEESIHQKNDLNIQLKSQQWVSNLS